MKFKYLLITITIINITDILSFVKSIFLFFSNILLQAHLIGQVVEDQPERPPKTTFILL